MPRAIGPSAYSQNKPPMIGPRHLQAAGGDAPSSASHVLSFPTKPGDPAGAGACGAAGRAELYATAWAMTCGGDPKKKQMRCANYSHLVVPVVLPTASALAGADGMQYGTLSNQTVPMLLTNQLAWRGWSLPGFDNCQPRARPVGRACPGYYPDGVYSWLHGTPAQPVGHRTMRIYGTDGTAARLAGGSLSANGDVIPGPDNLLENWNTTSACVGAFSNWKWKAGPAPFPGVWLDHTTARLAAQSDLFFHAYAAAGGALDEIIQDSELGPLFSSAYVAFGMVEPSAAAEACARERWTAIQSDARFPPMLEQLVEQGLRVNQSATEFLADAMSPDLADIEHQRVVWDSVMMEQAASVWEAAFITPARKYFPKLLGSNYDYKRWDSRFCVPRDSGWMFCDTDGPIGAAWNLTANTPMYNGFSPTAVAAALLLHYGVQNYSLTPFNIMRFAAMQARSLVFGGLQTRPPTLVKPWITYGSYHHGAIERWNTTTFGDYYVEQLFHLGCTQVAGFHYFNPPGWLDNSMPTLADHALLQHTLDELNSLIGCADRTWVVDLSIDAFSHGFFLTGIRTAQHTIWRWTPLHPSAARIVSGSGSVIVALDGFRTQEDGRHRNCTIVFDNAESPFQGNSSKSGWWVKQNRSSKAELVCADFRSQWPLPTPWEPLGSHE